jgi:hypothetical protein
MKLRALTSATINTEKGLRFVRGPEYNDNEECLEPGEIIDVPDDFEINPDVFEEVREVRPGIWEAVTKQERAKKPKTPAAT